MDLHLLSLLGPIFLMLLLSGFFSGSETALTAASRAKIHKLKAEGDSRAEAVVQLRAKKDELISTILLGNNAVNIGASALSTTIAIEYFGDKAVVYVTIILTILVLIFAEVMPKTYALTHAEKVALRVAPIFKVLMFVFGPIIKLVQHVVNALFWLLRINVKEDGLHKMSGTEALRGAIQMHHDDGEVIKDNRDMLGSVLDLAEMEVGEVMIHRKRMQTLSFTAEVTDIVEAVMSSSHTRIPLYEESSDDIIGILHAKDLLRALQAKGDMLTHDELRSILLDPWFIPENTNVLAQLNAFRKRRAHFAMVVDEYGDLMGLITLEDILEEIVGQIEDEYDISRTQLKREKSGGYIVDGTMTVRDLNRALDWSLPADEAITVAGLVIHESQQIPEPGQVFRFHGIRFDILERKKNQIIRLRIRNVSEN